MTLERRTVASHDKSKERIVSGRCEPVRPALPGIELRSLVSAECGATAFSTCTATFDPGSKVPYHAHGTSKAITILDGHACVAVEGRTYRLNRYDCIHVPAGVAHLVANPSAQHQLLTLYAFGSSQPTRTLADNNYLAQERGYGYPHTDEPEFIRRFQTIETYELSEGAFFRDLFAGRFGSVGICGGYGIFRAGSSLPCHFHSFDESITIVAGKATCLVEGTRYELTGCDTAFVPKGRAHRFLNCSDQDMAMIWVYSGTEPERTIVDACRCSGELHG